ncbi:hypothetical protein LUZ60_016317 [Juncus effusus]|nr:hypothetical protein LUZ60_016317 [Juncus effusus]
MDGEKQEVSQGHPLLRGGRKREKEAYSHGFSRAQIQSLSAICETIIPSVPMERCHVSSGKEGPPSKALEEFFLASGSDFNLPDEVAELLVKRGLNEAKILVRIMLWMLATRLGTFILCGFLSISCDFPFMHKFGDLPLEKREIVLQRWSRETRINPLRMFFLAIKIFSLFIFYSMTDEKSQNPTWKAIGYNLPTNPNPNPNPKTRPLEKGIIETLTHDNISLPKTLLQKGTIINSKKSKSFLSIQCDVVICGSGCGGSVAAAILSKKGYKVVILEKGNYFTTKDYTSLEGPSMDEMYDNGGIISTLDAKMMILAGSTVGGGTAVNWSACIKTPNNVLNDWSENDNLSLFKSLEYFEAMDKVFERLNVTCECSEEGFQNKVLRKGCENLGLDVEFVGRNSSENHFCGSCSFGCRNGDKKGADITWLKDAVNHGAVILSGVKAEKLILEKNYNGAEKKKKCVGVIAKSLNDKITYKLEIKSKVTISSCGALLTPPLMKNSGLTNPNIGKHLHLHPVVFAWGYFPDQQNPNLKGKVFEGGIITSIHKVQTPNPNPNSNSNSNLAIIEAPALGPGATATLFPWISGKDMKERMVRYDRTAHLLILARDTGSGSIETEGRIKYRLSPKDKENLKTGLKQALRILLSAGAVQVGTHRSDGQRLNWRGTGDDDELEAFLDTVDCPVGPRSKSEVWGLLSSAHQMGSCRMGRTGEEGAVEETGESWEAEGLFVCDASVLPSAVGVNPMVTIQSVAVCVASRVVEFLKKREKGEGKMDQLS